MTRVTGDVGRLQGALVTAIIPLVGNVITLLAMLVVIAIMDWQLALVVLLILPLFTLSSKRLANKIVDVSRGQRSAKVPWPRWPPRPSARWQWCRATRSKVICRGASQRATSAASRTA